MDRVATRVFTSRVKAILQSENIKPSLTIQFNTPTMTASNAAMLVGRNAASCAAVDAAIYMCAGQMMEPAVARRTGMVRQAHHTLRKQDLIIKPFPARSHCLVRQSGRHSAL